MNAMNATGAPRQGLRLPGDPPPRGITVLTHSKEDSWVMFRFYTGFVIGLLFPDIKDMVLFVYIWYTVIAAYMYYIGNWWVFRHTFRPTDAPVVLSDSVLLSGFYICLYTIGIGLSTSLFMARILGLGVLAHHHGHGHWWVELLLVLGLMGAAALIAQYHRTTGYLAFVFGQTLVIVAFMNILPGSTDWFNEHVLWLASLALFSLFFFIRGIQSFTNVLIASTIHCNIVALYATNTTDQIMVLVFNLMLVLVIAYRVYLHFH